MTKCFSSARTDVLCPARTESAVSDHDYLSLACFKNAYIHRDCNPCVKMSEASSNLRMVFQSCKRVFKFHCVKTLIHTYTHRNTSTPGLYGMAVGHRCAHLASTFSVCMCVFICMHDVCTCALLPS